ncbi:MAG: glycosyltransferase [Muribaculaceae bacterium]|nr:glycosyltransferase [Muribaculaceae bacterium]
MTDVHICADSEWGGAESRALQCALSSADDAIVVCAGAKPVMERFTAAGVKALGGKYSGLFASLNLSRVFRHLPAGQCRLHIHSPQVRPLVERSVQLAGRADLIVSPTTPAHTWPRRRVTSPAPDSVPTLMWMGRITPDCGLSALIEALGRLPGDSDWQLRIAGIGEARTVMPLVNRTRALAIADRVKWIGYTTDVFSAMNGVNLGVVTRTDPQHRTVTAEFASAGVPVICGTSSDSLFNELSSLL